MTRDEVMAMTDEELRREVCRIRGYQYVEEALTNNETGETIDVWMHYTMEEGKKIAVFANEVPDWTSSIAAAWDLHVDRCRSKPAWRERYAQSLAWVLQRDDVDDGLEITWPTALLFLCPRHITRAFILAMADKEATD